MKMAYFRNKAERDDYNLAETALIRNIHRNQLKDGPQPTYNEKNDKYVIMGKYMHEFVFTQI